MICESRGKEISELTYLTSEIVLQFAILHDQARINDAYRATKTILAAVGEREKFKRELTIVEH